jgi:hypothetical protein
MAECDGFAMNAKSDVEPARREPPTKPIFTVLIGHRGGTGACLEISIDFELGGRFDLRFLRFGDELGFRSEHETELVKLTETVPFDLILPYWQGAGRELFPRLKAQYGKPIVVVTGWTADNGAYAVFERAGIPVLQTPFTMEDIRRALQQCGLKSDDKPESQ